MRASLGGTRIRTKRSAFAIAFRKMPIASLKVLTKLQTPKPEPCRWLTFLCCSVGGLHDHEFSRFVERDPRLVRAWLFCSNLQWLARLAMAVGLPVRDVVRALFVAVGDGLADNEVATFVERWHGEGAVEPSEVATHRRRTDTLRSSSVLPSARRSLESASHALLAIAQLEGGDEQRAWSTLLHAAGVLEGDGVSSERSVPAAARFRSDRFRSCFDLAVLIGVYARSRSQRPGPVQNVRDSSVVGPELILLASFVGLIPVLVTGAYGRRGNIPQEAYTSSPTRGTSWTRARSRRRKTSAWSLSTLSAGSAPWRGLAGL